MKRGLTFLFFLLPLAGCATGEKGQVSSEGRARGGGRDLPALFVSLPYGEGIIYGAGVAKEESPQNSELQARQRARGDIRFQIRNRIEELLGEFFSEKEIEETPRTLGFSEFLLKKIESIPLEGLKEEQLYLSEEGRYYVLLSYPQDGLLDRLNAVFVGSQQEWFPEFQAEEMLERVKGSLAAKPLVSSFVAPVPY